MSKQKLKIMWITDGPFTATGYGSVGRNVLGRLAEKGHECHAVTANYNDNRLDGFVYDGKQFNIKVYPRLKDDHGADALIYYGSRIKPDVVITLRDVGLQEGYIDPVMQLKKLMVQEKLKPCKWVGHVPIDTCFLPKAWIKVFKGFDHTLAMSEHGVKMIKQFFGLDVPFIPHGVDTKIFRPLPIEEVQELRKKRNIDTMFVAGGCGRNQLRKMWNQLIRAFSEFGKNRMDVTYLFHSDIHATFISDGWSWQAIAEKYGGITIQPDGSMGKSLFNPTWIDMTIAKRRDVDDSELNKFYNMIDVYMFLTGGEGFGIPTLEALATGRPLIITDNTTGPELAKDHGILVPELKDKYGDPVRWEGQNGVEFSIPDWREAKKALEKYYENPKLRAEHSKKALEFAKKFDYDLIADRWEEYLLKVVNEN